MKGPGKKVVTDVKLMDLVATKERYDSVSKREKGEHEKLYGGYGYVIRRFDRGLKNFHVVYRIHRTPVYIWKDGKVVAQKP